MNVLIKFAHGLGDAIQLTIVLRHLQKYRSDWNVDVFCLHGKHSALAGFCRRAYHDREPRPEEGEYDHIFDLGWWENYSPFANSPSTKPSNCLRDVFDLQPDPALFEYSIEIGEAATNRAEEYLKSICGLRRNVRPLPVVILHYEGNTAAEKKNLTHDQANQICHWAVAEGFVPVILDWDRRSPLIDQKTVFCPTAEREDLWGGFGSGDAEMIAALIEHSSLMIGVDSGPLHVAGATGTPTIGVWLKHHPMQYFDLCRNVTHVIPGNWPDMRPCGEQPAREFFENNYRFTAYPEHGLVASVLGAACELLGRDKSSAERFSKRIAMLGLTATGYGKRYYEEHKAAGLDYLAFGQWQQSYAGWLVESLDLTGKSILDVGCACGAITRGLKDAGTTVLGVDVNEYMIQLGRRQWPDMADRLHVCDAVNLHLLDAGTFDWVHTTQVAEHWKPELVPLILRELARVTKPGGLMFCALDTAELLDEHARPMAEEDPSHVCIRTMSWWSDQLRAAGWRVRSDDFLERLESHPESFLRRYKWPWFIAQKVEALA